MSGDSSAAAGRSISASALQAGCVVLASCSASRAADTGGLRHDISRSSGECLRAYFLQIAILANHQNGRDSHVRQIRVFGPRRCGAKTIENVDWSLKQPAETRSRDQHSSVFALGHPLLCVVRGLFFMHGKSLPTEGAPDACP